MEKKKYGRPREIRPEDYPVAYERLIRYAKKRNLIISRFYIVEGGNTGSHLKAELKKDMTVWPSEIDYGYGVTGKVTDFWWRMVYLRDSWSTWG